MKMLMGHSVFLHQHPLHINACGTFSVLAAAYNRQHNAVSKTKWHGAHHLADIWSAATCDLPLTVLSSFAVAATAAKHVWQSPQHVSHSMHHPAKGFGLEVLGC